MHGSRGSRCMVPGGSDLSDVEDRAKFIRYRLLIKVGCH
jgi:hypothetical protein